MSKKFNRNAMERELGTRIDGAIVVPKPQNRRPSRTRDNAASRFCFICLRRGEAAPRTTDAHVFNKRQRAEWPPALATWSDKRRMWTILPTGVVINGETKLFMGGRWDELRRLVAPVCEECRQMEQMPDRAAQQMEIVRGIGDGRVTLTGLPPRAVVRAGDVVTIEDWRPLAEEVVRLKTRYFLDATAVAIASPPQDLEWWRRFLLLHPARQALIDGLQHDYAARARIASRNGAERWRHRVIRPLGSTQK